MSFIDDLANAIYRFEGATSTSLATRNNNPGNLRSGPGMIGVDQNGYAIFPDMAAGFAALKHQISLNISRGLTLNEFFSGKPGVYPGYAPAADQNQPYRYASAVAGWLGIDPNTPLYQYAGIDGGRISQQASQEQEPFQFEAWVTERLIQTPSQAPSGVSPLLIAAVVLLGVVAVSR